MHFAACKPDLPGKRLWLIVTTTPFDPKPLNFFFNDAATTEIYTLSLHDALPIFTDANSNGVHDASEALTTVGTTETDASTGAWSFTGLGPLTGGQKYFVSEAGESGWTQTFGTAGDVITPTSGTNSTTNNFANFKNFTISGTKYRDVNGDDATAGITLSGSGGDDTVLSGVKIDLFNHDSVANTNTLITTVTTLANGSYSFT